MGTRQPSACRCRVVSGVETTSGSTLVQWAEHARHPEKWPPLNAYLKALVPQTICSTEIPYPLMWGKWDWLPLRLEGEEYEISFERAWRSGSGTEMKYDRLGRVSYTKIAVRFPYATTGNDVEELKMITHKAINRLLDVYRVSTKEFHIGHIPVHELGMMDIAHGMYNKKDDGSIWECHTVRGDAGSGITLSRTAEMDAAAERDLQYERPLSIVDLLVLNARRSLLFEEYRIAVVEAETAFELGVHRILTRYYLSQTTKSTEGYVVPAHSWESVDRLLDPGLTNLIKDHLPKALGREFIGTDEHHRWREDLYSLRNKVVHEGKVVHSDQAKRALASAEDALVWIGAVNPHQWPANDRLNQTAGTDDE